jgi:hypothetical protein
MLGLHLDKPRTGQHYSDRYHRIMGTFHAMGVLWDEETIANRDGSTYKQRRELIRPSAGSDNKPICIVTPQYEKYGFSVYPKVLKRVQGLAPQLAYSLNVPRVFVEVDGDTIYVRVPRDQADAPLTFDAAWALAPDIPAGSLLLGQDDSGAQVVLNMADPGNVHAGVIGMPGSGKSTLMKTMILSALMTGQRVALFDPSGGFYPLSGHPSVWRGGMYRRHEDCERGLGLLAAQMEMLPTDMPAPTFVFVDEAPELISGYRAIGEHLERIARIGRHAGYHLILGAQDIDAHQALFKHIRARLVGCVADAGVAYRATSRNDSGAEHLRGGGDFVSCTGAGLRHFQAAMCGTLDEWAHRYPPRIGEPFAKPEPPTRVAMPAPRLQVMQSTAPIVAELQGRGVDAIPARVVRDIMVYRTRNRRWPSLHHCQSWLGFRNAKTRRAVNLACLKCGLPLEYPDWQEDYRVDAKLEVGR